MRIQLLAALAALALTAPGAQAAAKPQITDPAGDAVALGAGYDIVSGLFKTEGVTERVGRRAVYTPTKLVVVVTYAAAVPADDYATQAVRFDAPGCTGVYLQRYSGGTWGIADCLADAFDFSVKASGKTVTFTLPFKVLGKAHLFKGGALTGLHTYTAVADPVLGYESYEVAAGLAGAVDEGRSAVPYKIA